MTARQETEANLLKQVAEKEWEIEGINTLADSVALEYKLRSKLPQPGGGRAYCIIRGVNTEVTDHELKANLESQLKNAPILKTA